MSNKQAKSHLGVEHMKGTIIHNARKVKKKKSKSKYHTYNNEGKEKSQRMEKSVCENVSSKGHKAGRETAAGAGRRSLILKQRLTVLYDQHWRRKGEKPHRFQCSGLSYVWPLDSELH